MELVHQIKQDGIAKGLCRLWQMKLKPGLGVDSLAELYIRGIDFCIKNDYPTLDFLRTNFKGKCEDYGVYVDDEVVEKNRKDVVLNGDCKAMLEYDGFAVSNIYIRHNSKASVNVGDHAIVTIDIFDNSYLAIAVAGKYAKVLVNVYGKAAVEIAGGINIKIRYVGKDTY
ncbi:hypothetical protein [Muribaculum sp. An287]|uniref:hypothetical protein n=1 Tax=Muribaculum sp. An287 TaxID=1965623 RepID=UPI000B368E97|nr:hypothetical protein [Muribaculum sp. An287]OUO42963.1 hypothetical protein B5F81_06240 [Muribaculum sp. An287]